MVRFEEFRVGDLFDISTTKSIDKNKLTLSPDGLYDFIGRGVTNCGIQGCLRDKLDYNPNPANVFSLIQIGQTQVFWREKPWYASQNIFMLTPKVIHICNVYLFLQTSLNKSLEKYRESYTTYPTKSSLENELKFQLPIQTINNQPILDPEKTYHPEGYIPDWDYMQERIEELEQERIEELEQYLVATGLNDYELTDEDKAVLTKEPVMVEFKVGDLFKTSPYRDKFQVLTGGIVPANKLVDGTTPRVSVTSKNNGIIGYFDDIALKSYRLYTNSISVSFLGTVFYHPYKASFDMKVHCLQLKSVELTEGIALFIIPQIKKLTESYNYGTQLSSTDLVNIILDLPVVTDKNNQPVLDDKNKPIPDWDYMEQYIKATQKQVIRDVVDYKNQVIAKTKEVVHN